MSFRAVIERDFFGYVQRERFFVIRALVVGVPLVVVMAAALEFQAYEAGRIGQSILEISIYPLVVGLLFLVPNFFAPLLSDERKNGKLEVLKSSPVSIPRIVAARWTARFFLVGCMWLAFLPIPTLSLLWGGVAMTHVFGAAAISAGVIFWASAFSFVVGALTRDTVLATRWSYAAVSAWVLVPRVLAAFLDQGAGKGIAGFDLEILHRIEPFGALESLFNGPEGRFSTNPAGFRTAIAFLLFSVGTVVVLVPLAGILLTFFDTRKKRSDGRDSHGGFETEGHDRDGDRRVGALLTWLANRPAPLSGVLWRHPALWLEYFGSAPAARSRLIRTVAVIVVVVCEAAYWTAFLTAKASGPGIGVKTTLDWYRGAVASILAVAFFQVLLSGMTVMRRDNESRFREVLFSTPMTSAHLVFGHVLFVAKSAVPWLFLALIHVLVGSLRSELPAWSFLVHLPLAVLCLLEGATLGVQHGLGRHSMAGAVARLFLEWAIMLTVVLLLFLRIGAVMSGGSSLRLVEIALPFSLPTAVWSEQTPPLRIVAAVFTAVYSVAYALRIHHKLKVSLPKLYLHRREDLSDHKLSPEARLYGGRFKLIR